MQSSKILLAHISSQMITYRKDGILILIKKVYQRRHVKLPIYAHHVTWCNTMKTWILYVSQRIICRCIWKIVQNMINLSNIIITESVDREGCSLFLAHNKTWSFWAFVFSHNNCLVKACHVPLQLFMSTEAMENRRYKDNFH